MNNIYQLENGTLLTSEQLNGHLIKFMNVDNTPTYYYSDSVSDLKSDSKKKREQAHNELQRIRLVPTDKETMSLLFDGLENKNDIVNTPNFYNYIAKVINSANNKMLRYRSEKLAFEHLNDIRQFFFIDIFERTIEINEEKALIDFNNFNSMQELNRTLYKIATQELNKRLYKLYRDISLDKEIQGTMDTVHANKFMQEIEIALDREHNDYKEYAQRLERYNEIIKSIATETQLENYYKVLAKKTYEQTTTYEERQAMSEEQKLATYKLTSTERSNYRHLVAKVQDRIK